MLTLWLITTVLLAVVLVVMIPILLGKGRYGMSDRKQQNIALAQARLQELETDHKNNMLDESAYKEARQDIERALLQDVDEKDNVKSNTNIQTTSSAIYTSIAVAFLLPVITVTLYLLLGNPFALKTQSTNLVQPSTSAVVNEQAPHADDEMQGMIQKLASRLQTEPNNPDGWDLLARSYMSVKQYPQAVNALEKLHALVGDHADVLVRLADATAMANGGSFAGKPAQYIAQALAREPNNTTALWLAGMDAQARQDWHGAIKYWQQARQGLANEPQAQAELDQLISHAQSASTSKGAVPAATTPGTNQAVIINNSEAKLKAGIVVHVSLDSALAQRVSKNDTVFILAQMLDGPPMPLAVVKKRVADLPLTITLDDTLAMMPSHKLSMHKQVRVTARISKSGNARAEPGDTQVVKAPVSNTQEVNLVIK